MNKHGLGENENEAVHTCKLKHAHFTNYEYLSQVYALLSNWKSVDTWV